jgi:hypothetical protein
MIDLQHSQIVMVLVASAGPYLTQFVHFGIEWLTNSVPFWMKPLLPIFMGMVASSISKYAGVELPLGLSHISEDQIVQITGSGYVLGTISAHLNDFLDGLKKTHSPDTNMGKLLNALTGAHTPSQMRMHVRQAPTIPPAV